MKLFNLREAASRILFWGQNIRYLTKRTHVLTVFMLVLIMLSVFTFVFVNQRNRLERSQNILKSFYEGGGEAFPDEDGTANSIAEPVLIEVHVCGEVRSPGVYQAEMGSRVIDLIELAGGATEAACTDLLNLAQKVSDGQKIYVPSREEVVTAGIQGNGDINGLSQGSGYSPIININTASKTELESLPGIGPVTAEKIIRYRQENGQFGRKEEIMDVGGIGPAKFEAIKDLIDV